jgi:hypothetical protein
MSTSTNSLLCPPAPAEVTRLSRMPIPSGIGHHSSTHVMIGTTPISSCTRSSVAVTRMSSTDMSSTPYGKYALASVGLALIFSLNGVVRDTTYATTVGDLAAHQISDR